MYVVRVLGDGNAGVGSGGGVVAASAYMGGTRGSGVLYITGDVLEMGVVRGVGGVCDMCLARGDVGGEGGEWMRGLGLGFTCGTGGVLDVCLCFGCGGVCGVGGEWVGGLDQGLEGWGYVCVSCETGLSV